MKNLILYHSLIVILVLATITCKAQSAKDVRGAAPVTPLTSEPAAKLIVDQPLADQLIYGRVVIQYRTENCRIIAVFGQAAVDVSPRVGHLHITVDEGPWRWVDSSNEPLIINLLPAGKHRILLELADPAHHVIDSQSVTFVVPKVKVEDKYSHGHK